MDTPWAQVSSCSTMLAHSIRKEAGNVATWMHEARRKVPSSMNVRGPRPGSCAVATISLPFIAKASGDLSKAYQFNETRQQPQSLWSRFDETYLAQNLVPFFFSF